MKKLTFTLLAFLMMGSLYAQDIAKTWYGTLNIQGTALRVVFNISKTGDSYITTMDSPDQGVKGIPTDKTIFSGNQLIIEASKMALVYTGTYTTESNTITGIFKQGSGELPLTLSAKSTDPQKVVPPEVRPQDPKDFPYKQEDVVFDNAQAGVQLAGTLTLPTSGKVDKIVVLISGSGPQNRNEEIQAFNHRPFLVWSDWLTRNNIAVLRYDDRGVGKSTGIYKKATTADFASDAEAAVRYIQSRADLKAMKLGLIGHSEGGLIAPIVANQDKTVQFIVLLAGPGIPINELLLEQSEDQARLAGAPAGMITRSSALNKTLYTAVKKYKDLPEPAFQAKIDTVLHDALKGFSVDALGGRSMAQVISESKVQVSSIWFKYFVGKDPGVNLKRIKCPVLALNGTLDSQVRSTSNLSGIKSNLQKAGNKKFEIVAMPGLNHLFQKSATGAVSEYKEIAETVNPETLQRVSTWINKL